MTKQLNNKDISAKKITARKVKHLTVETNDVLDQVKAKMLTEHNEKLSWDELIIDMAKHYSNSKKLNIKIAS